MKKNKFNVGIISLLFLVIGVTFVSAAPGVAMLEGPFRQLFQILRSTSIVYGLTLIFYLMLFYGIYAAALKFVPVFKGSSGLSHQGKVVALALTGLTILSLFFFTKGDITKVLHTLLDPFGVFAGLALAALFAGVTYFGIRGGAPNSATFAWVATAAGLGMVIAGMILLKDNIMSWGFLIFAISLIIALIAQARGGASNDEPAPEIGPAPPLPPRPPPRRVTPPPPPPPPNNIRIDSINAENDIDNSAGPVVVRVIGEHLDQVSDGRIVDISLTHTFVNFTTLRWTLISPTEATIEIPGCGTLPNDTYQLILNDGSTANQTYHSFRIVYSTPPSGTPTITHINIDNTPINNHISQVVLVIGTNLDTVTTGLVIDDTGRTIIDNAHFGTLGYNIINPTQAEITIPDSLPDGNYFLYLTNAHGSGDRNFSINKSHNLTYYFAGMAYDATSTTGINHANIFFSASPSTFTTTINTGGYQFWSNAVDPRTTTSLEIVCAHASYTPIAFDFNPSTATNRIVFVNFPLTPITLPTSLPPGFTIWP